MTPAIQKQIEIHTRSEAEAAAQSLNLSHIFKKMKPFPEKMDRPPLVVGLDLGRGRWHAVFQSARKSGYRDFPGMGKARALVSAIRSEMGLLGLSDTPPPLRDSAPPREIKTGNNSPVTIVKGDHNKISQTINQPSKSRIKK